jgi:phosphatidyl-myo-inositol alpha-mannosyltransferase
MRIGMFSPYSLSLPGGVQGQVLGLARALRRQGHDCRVLGPCDGPPPEPGVITLGNAIPFATNGSVAPIAPDPSAALRTWRALTNERFDIVHLHEPLVPGCTMTALVLKSAPIVGTFHLAGESESYKRLRGVVRKLADRIDVRCAVSETAATMARVALGGHYDVLFNGVDLNRFRGAEPWPTEAPTILFVGRHEPRKGLETLLAALPKVAGDLRVWVVGSGPQTESLKARYTDKRIQWLGRIPDHELARRWRAASVYCAPSLGGESFGVVLLESMAAGVPVIASDIDGYRLVARNGIDSILVAPSDPPALAHALTTVLTNAHIAQSLRTEGAKRADEYSFDALADEYVKRYRTLLR